MLYPAISDSLIKHKATLEVLKLGYGGCNEGCDTYPDRIQYMCDYHQRLSKSRRDCPP